MAEVILSEELGVGDVFFDPRRAGPTHQGDWHPAHGLRRVKERRTFTTGSGSYARIKYAKLDDIATGEIDLRVDVAMCRVHPISSDLAVLKVAKLVDGERVTVWHAEGRLWA